MEQKNKQLMIFLAGELQNRETIAQKIWNENFDFYAADAGYRYAMEFGVSLHRVFGDFDSMPCPTEIKPLVFPTEKDQTDSEIALDLAIQDGYNTIWMIAPFGGRLDHTWANICLLEKAYKYGAELHLYDGVNHARLLQPGSTHFDGKASYYSFFPWNGTAIISLHDFKYPLERYELKTEEPLGISNEAKGPDPEITVHSGQILSICIETDKQEEL